MKIRYHIKEDLSYTGPTETTEWWIRRIKDKKLRHHCLDIFRLCLHLKADSLTYATGWTAVNRDFEGDNIFRKADRGEIELLDKPTLL